MAEEERTIAFADLSGFTALTEAHGDEAGTEIALRFYEMTRSVLRGGAVLVKTIGDAVMLAVPDSRNAVEIVLALQALTDSTPNFPILRAGLHAGPANEACHDYFGACVNIAARVAAHARAGQILCTAAVAERIADSHLCTAIRLGPVTFHNVHDPVVVYELRRASAVGTSIIDPVCRMHVTAESSVARVRRGTGDAHFCSVACLRRWLQEAS